MEYLGKLHQAAVEFPQTDIWMDSCGEEELEYGLKRGIVGATSNPIIVGNVIKNELNIWEKRIKEMVVEMKDASEEDIAWELIYEIGALRSKKLLPVFEANKGKKGRLSLQVNAKYYRNKDKMVEQAVKINSLAPNMQVKIPASAAGVEAMEEATYRGISINATVSFTVAQAVAVAEAVERGLKRREAEGLDNSQMAPICTIMIGRTDDWLKKNTTKTGQVVLPEVLEWSGVAVIKEAYRIYKERGYTTRLLSAAMLACKAMGVSKIIVSDALENRLALALQHGADYAINVKNEDAVEKVMEYTDGEGCDIVFETAGSPVTLASTWKYVKTAGVIVNVGNASGEIPFVFGELARKEVDIRSVWRYRNIYPIAIEAVRTGKIDLKHIEPAMFPFEKSQEAFEYAFEHRSEVLKTIIQVTE